MFSFGDIFIIVAVVTVLIVVGLYYLNRWAAKKMSAQQDAIDKNKQNATIFVIDKKRDYAKNVNLPKIVMDNLPKTYRRMKMNFVKAKVGPQIVTMICDKKVFEAMPEKKNVNVEIAGIYILGIKGMKTEAQKKAAEKEKKNKQKAEEKAAKEAEKAAAKTAKAKK